MRTSTSGSFPAWVVQGVKIDLVLTLSWRQIRMLRSLIWVPPVSQTSFLFSGKCRGSSTRLSLSEDNRVLSELDFYTHFIKIHLIISSSLGNTEVPRLGSPSHKTIEFFLRQLPILSSLRVVSLIFGKNMQYDANFIECSIEDTH